MTFNVPSAGRRSVTSRLRRRVPLVAAALALVGWALSANQAPQIDSSVFGELRYRYIGPPGNRVSAVAGVPGQPNIYYAGAASGGIWKTTDGGTYWEPIFDAQPVSSIGSIAVAPSDPNIVWAGTGESWIRSNISIGNGVYRSTDAGRTWTHMGLEETGRIARVAIDPRNPETVLACALGHAYGPQPQRGVFRTTDGGKTWTRALFVDEDTGCSDLGVDPNNSQIVFAGMWQLDIKTWGRESGGPGSGLFRSTDGGATWQRLTGGGLPTRPVGKVAVAVAASNSDRVYALIETGDGVPWHGRETDTGTLWRSEDGGATWQMVSRDRNLTARTHYFTHLAVAPDNQDEVFFAGAFAMTSDGGLTSRVATGTSSPGGDNHVIWIDPTNSRRIVVGNDGGVSLSVNRGRTWQRVQLPIAQMYHVYVDNQIPYNVYGNRQDGPSFAGPSNSRLASGIIPRAMWHSVAGGESGFAIPDPVDNNIIWSTASGYGSAGGLVQRFDERRRQARRVEIWPERTFGSPPADLKFRFNWTFPIAISPHDHKKVYAGSQYVHVTTDGGESWRVISPDLTTNDKNRQQISGGLTPDNLGVEYGCVIFAIAESSLEQGLIWVGTNDGLVQVTRNGGVSWTNVTASIPGLPPWGTVSNIEPSRHHLGTAYITVDLHQVNDRAPYVYKTTDYGRTWTLIASGIPRSMLSYAHCIREDPVRPGLLYLGTENAIYNSFDDGENWRALQGNLPHAPVHWLVVQEHFNDLVIGTYGRGFWVLDDIAPLRELTSRVLDSNAFFFAPRTTYRFQPITEPMSHADSASEFSALRGHDPSAGENPPYGAPVTYFLKSVPKGDVTIRILDANGRHVRTLQGSKSPGINRIWWDLKSELSKEIRLRMSPAYAPHVHVGPEGWRPLPEGGRVSILMPPGAYTMKLTVEGRELTQTLTVRKDPNSEGSESDVQSQTQMLIGVRADLEAAADMVNLIESVRWQIHNVSALLETTGDAAAARSAAGELDRTATAIEDRLIQRRLTGAGDGVRWPPQLVSKLAYLAEAVASVDFAPTAQQRDVHTLLKQQLAGCGAQLDELVRRDVRAFNNILKERQIGTIITRVPNPNS